MEKDKYTLRVDNKVLKQMKIFAIEQNKPLNEIIVDAFIAYSKLPKLPKITK